MRVLIVTKIFPNRAEPHACSFNRQQFAALSRRCQVEVLATIPWFPGAESLSRWSRAGRLGAVPPRDRIDGLWVSHPRFVYLPKVGAALTGPLYAASLLPTVLPYRGAVDVVLGSWAYPDGFAAILLGRLLGVPAVVKVHGSDINVLGQRRLVRSPLGWALSRADRVVAVSRALAERVAQLGAASDRIDVVPNGIDRRLFRPLDRAVARSKLGLSTARPVVLFVGRLERSKGVLDLVRALGSLRHADLVLVGDGPAMQDCKRLAAHLGVRARFAGERPHDELPEWMAAADVLALPSWSEGTPNVVLEALACGRRVIATNVGGIPDVVSSAMLGEIVEPRQPQTLGRALRSAVGAMYDPTRVAELAAIPSWDESASRLEQSLLAALGNARSKAA